MVIEVILVLWNIIVVIVAAGIVTLAVMVLFHWFFTGLQWLLED